MPVQRSRKLTSIEAHFFGLRWLAEYVARSSARAVLRRNYYRTSEAVVEEYEEKRRNDLDRFRTAPVSLEEYILSEADDAIASRYLQVLDGSLYSGGLREATKTLQKHLIEAVHFYRPESLTEFGCGNGRNLLAIKRAYPHVRCIGLELTQSSVELARLASRHYGLHLEVHLADVSKPLPQVTCTDVCFSVHALEQIPDSCAVFEQMCRLARKAVVLFEPIVELYGWNPRGIAARIRARHLDRLRGLFPYVLRAGYKVRQARLLDVAGNALNQTAELHVVPKVAHAGHAGGRDTRARNP